MRKVILGLAVSLDGFIEGPNGEFDWCFTDQDYGMSEFFKRIDAVFIGRKSYELTLKMKAENTWMPPVNTYVFSNTLKALENDAILISGDIEKQVRELKEAPGKDIWLFGGGSLIASLMNLRLVDEISMAVHPILLGSGTPLFRDIKERIHLELIESKVYSSGLVSVSYALNKASK